MIEDTLGHWEALEQYWLEWKAHVDDCDTEKIIFAAGFFGGAAAALKACMVPKGQPGDVKQFHRDMLAFLETWENHVREAIMEGKRRLQ